MSDSAGATIQQKVKRSVGKGWCTKPRLPPSVSLSQLRTQARAPPPSTTTPHLRKRPSEKELRLFISNQTNAKKNFNKYIHHTLPQLGSTFHGCGTKYRHTHTVERLFTWWLTQRIFTVRLGGKCGPEPDSLSPVLLKQRKDLTINGGRLGFFPYHIPV